MFNLNLDYIKNNIILSCYPSNQNIIDFIERLEKEKIMRVSSRNPQPDVFNILWSIYLFEKQTDMNILEVSFATTSGQNWVNIDANFISIKLFEDFDSNIKSILLLSE